MPLVRSHLRLGVAAWLVCHLLTFATLVVCDCCPMTDAGAPAVAEAAPCHETAPPPPEPHCEHLSNEGAACPMHRSASAPPAADCAMSGACGAAGAMLQTVLLQPAVLSAAVTIGAPVDAPAPSVNDRPSAVSLAVPPDAPPPRA